MNIAFAGKSDLGLQRQNNEDNYLMRAIDDDNCLLFVADGVGGNNCGEVASATVVEVFTALLADTKLQAASDPAMRPLVFAMAVHRAHAEISKLAQQDPQYQGMACTFTGVIADREQVCLMQVGDSRCYHLSQGKLTQMSVDQTRALALLSEGKISAQEASSHPDKNTLSQALGVEAQDQTLQAAKTIFAWQSGDELMLCSDGLSDLVDEQEIEKIITGAQSLAAAVDNLISAALRQGGKDNITVICARNERLKPC